MFSILTLSCEEKLSKAEDNINYDGRTLFKGIMLGQGPVADIIPEIKQILKVDLLISNEERLEKVNKYTDVLLDLIAIYDPNCFNEFKLLITSGDQLKIQEAIGKGGRAILKALRGLPTERNKIKQILNNPKKLDELALKHNIDPNANRANLQKASKEIMMLLENEPVDDGGDEMLPPPLVYTTYWFVYIAVASEVGVVVNVAVVQAAALVISIEFYIAVHQDKYLYQGIDSGDQPRLLQEQIINRIAISLKQDVNTND